MNRQRRKDLNKAIELLETAKEIIEAARYEEQEAYDNMPEGLQESERGEKMYNAIDSMENALMDFDGIIDNIYEAIEP